MLKSTCSISVLVLTMSISSAFAADKGVKDKTITLGQSAPLRGPSGALGEGLQIGMQACFKKVNDAGGIHGRKIELKTFNDDNDPIACARATQDFLNADGVFALIGYVGTSATELAAPLAAQTKTPFISPLCGSNLLKPSDQTSLINIRATQAAEMEAIAQRLVDGNGLKKVACFYQDDAFGVAGLASLEAALAHRHIKLIARGSFDPNNVDINNALTTIAAAAPNLIVTIAPSKPLATFIRNAMDYACVKDVKIVASSIVSVNALINKLGESAEGIILTQVVPPLYDTSNLLIINFNADMNAAGTMDKADAISLEGYLNARIFCQVLAKIEGEPTRERFLNLLKTTDTWDIDGFPLSFGPNDHQGSDRVWLTKIGNGKIAPFAAPLNIASIKSK